MSSVSSHGGSHCSYDYIAHSVVATGNALCLSGPFRSLYLQLILGYLLLAPTIWVMQRLPLEILSWAPLRLSPILECLLSVPCVFLSFGLCSSFGEPHPLAASQESMHRKGILGRLQTEK